MQSLMENRIEKSEDLLWTRSFVHQQQPAGEVEGEGFRSGGGELLVGVAMEERRVGVSELLDANGSSSVRGVMSQREEEVQRVEVPLFHGEMQKLDEGIGRESGQMSREAPPGGLPRLLLWKNSKELLKGCLHIAGWKGRRGSVRLRGEEGN